jgi:hypothetical protein
VTGPRRIAVRTELVLEHMVDRILAGVEERYPGEAPAHVVERGEIAIRGYLSRIVETELFTAARAVTPGLRQALSEEDDAVDRLAERIVRAEPLGKPSPGDERAFTWRVPGPGGHVRHFVALATLRDAGLHDRELKRQWLYGFVVRCCEEALGPDPRI